MIDPWAAIGLHTMTVIVIAVAYRLFPAFMGNTEMEWKPLVFFWVGGIVAVCGAVLIQ
jgi:hypothetical protein